MNQAADRRVAVAVFDQGRVRGHVSLWLYARALDRYVKRLGIHETVVFYKPGPLGDGLINELFVMGRLPESQWRSIAIWSRRCFPQLIFGKEIEKRLWEFERWGATGDERALELRGL